ncbi:MAG: tetratricopeptide repeat protein [Bacteroidota bacterium]
MICISRFAGYSATESEIQLISRKADSLYQVKQFQLAGIYYDQVVYLAQDNITKTKALLNKADCYLERKDFTKAEAVLSRIFYADLNDSLIYLSRYKSALASYLNGNFSEAASQVIQARSFIADTTLVVNIFPLYVLILNESLKYVEAKEVLLSYIKTTHRDSINKSAMLREVELYYQNNKIPHLKSPEKAKKLSMFLPGTGQLYAGYFWEGALNVGLQLFGLGFTGVCVYNKYYFTGGLIGFAIFQKFYGGGMNRAQFLTEKRNYKITRRFNDGAKKLVLSVR